MGCEVLGGKLSPWLSRRRLGRARPFLRGRVLDYGCNNGALAAMCQPDAYLGVDINESSLELARVAHPQFQFDTKVSEHERFDTIAALALIEHVSDPGDLLAQWAGMLAPGGAIVLTTPHPSFEWVHTLGANLRIFSSHAHEEHEELLDRGRLQALADGAELEIETYHRFLLGANQLVVLRRKPGTETAAG
jgi:2-polyprenyl-3-methyl-5-hydroxy-6-metoxy-1,4-benzoquinol methylase